jgi:sulfonate transport system ATP-binding protein
MIDVYGTDLREMINARAVLVEGLSKHFDGRYVLRSLDFEIPVGQFVAVLGASGSGKTTLLRILAGLDSPDEGEVLVPPNRTVVFQEPRLIQSMRVWRNVVIGQRGKLGSRPTASEALREVGLEPQAEAWPGTLSGGEAQRVALARALVRQPQLMLLDEPLAALDALTRLNMQQLIVELWRRHGPAVLFVTHDVEEAIVLADRIVVLRAGSFATDVIVGLDRPRDVGDPAFTRLRQELLAELGVQLAGGDTGGLTEPAYRPRIPES